MTADIVNDDVSMRLNIHVFDTVRHGAVMLDSA